MLNFFFHLWLASSESGNSIAADERIEGRALLIWSLTAEKLLFSYNCVCPQRFAFNYTFSTGKGREGRGGEFEKHRKTT